MSRIVTFKSVSALTCVPFAALTNATKADHGFTMDSRPVREFLAHMAGLTVEERREFLSFMTGSCVPPMSSRLSPALTFVRSPRCSPRLPIGGFAALDPPLTIVRKDGGDAVLPSVMSCVNYVKLPDYSSREVLKERILLAVREGAGGFHLSAYGLVAEREARLTLRFDRLSGTSSSPLPSFAPHSGSLSSFSFSVRFSVDALPVVLSSLLHASFASHVAIRSTPSSPRTCVPRLPLHSPGRCVIMLGHRVREADRDIPANIAA